MCVFHYMGFPDLFCLYMQGCCTVEVSTACTLVKNTDHRPSRLTGTQHYFSVTHHAVWEVCMQLSLCNMNKVNIV